MHDFGLYIIMTNPKLDHILFAEQCVREEVPMLQLREKGLNDRELLDLATRIADLTAGTNTCFTIDDRPDIAILSKAAGIHVGPEDIHWIQARKLVGNKFLGVSTHSLKEVDGLSAEILENAAHLKPDYMSFGPVFETNAKVKPDEPVGLEKLSLAVARAPLPLVAIGGIFKSNLEDVLKAGARNVAMIRQFNQAKDIAELRTGIREIKAMIKEYTK